MKTTFLFDWPQKEALFNNLGSFQITNELKWNLNLIPLRNKNIIKRLFYLIFRSQCRRINSWYLVGTDWFETKTLLQLGDWVFFVMSNKKQKWVLARFHSNQTLLRRWRDFGGKKEKAASIEKRLLKQVSVSLLLQWAVSVTFWSAQELDELFFRNLRY